MGFQRVIERKPRPGPQPHHLICFMLNMEINSIILESSLFQKNGAIDIELLSEAVKRKIATSPEEIVKILSFSYLGEIEV
jgi:hypothetical protein